MKEILLLGKGISNNALHQFMLRYSIEHDYLDVEEVYNYNYKLVIKGPGVFYNTLSVSKFIEQDSKVITDIEFIYWFLNKEFIGVTGTNGKTTTTYLITEIINQKYSAIACGNCGYPISQAALDYKLYKYFVVELSSFQLKGTIKFTPKIAVVTNIKQAHLDYHKGVEDYYKSKFNITKNQSKNDYLIYNLDDENSCMLLKNSEASKITYSLKNKSASIFYNNGIFYFNKKRLFSKKGLNIKTDIMKYNVMASIGVAKLLGIENKYIVKGIKKFKNIKYRLEEVYKDIYNDAKSTNIYATISALNEFLDRRVLLICGGYDRKEEINLSEFDLNNVSMVYAYGNTKEKLLLHFKKLKVNILVFDTLKEATLKALNDRKDEVILYSPMFASYDQYSSFEERGKEFNKIIFKYYEKQ